MIDRPVSSVAQIATAWLVGLVLAVAVYGVVLLTFQYAEIVSCSKNPAKADANTCIVHTGPVSKTYP